MEGYRDLRHSGRYAVGFTYAFFCGRCDAAERPGYVPFSGKRRRETVQVSFSELPFPPLVFKVRDSSD